MRSPVDQICGGPCRNTIHRGQPMLVIQLPGRQRRFLRCIACAEEAMPTDLPPLVEQPSVTELVPRVPARMLSAGSVLPFDWKRLGAGDREPGEDG